jgi:Pectate lyase superfamily protein
MTTRRRSSRLYLFGTYLFRLIFLECTEISMLKESLVLSLTLFSFTAAFAASSYYPERLEDAKAVYVTSGNFPVHGDGQVDDTNAIQQAINQQQETNSEGVVFIPSGTYRLTTTLYVWSGIRMAPRTLARTTNRIIVRGVSTTTRIPRTRTSSANGMPSTPACG